MKLSPQKECTEDNDDLEIEKENEPQ